MVKNEAKRILQDVSRYMEEHPDAILASWSAIYNGTDHFCIRGDLLFLNLIQVEDGEVIFRRIRPASIIQGETGGPEQLYSIRDLVRINNGRRKGQVLPVSYLHDDETYVPSGLRKRLNYDMVSDSFHIKRKGDIASLELLKGMVEDCRKQAEAVPISSLAPALRLVCREGQENLHMRRNGATLKWLRGHDAQPGEDADSTGRRIAHTYAQPAGKGMVSYPYEHYYGKGIVAIPLQNDNMSMGRWYKVTYLEGSLPGIVFKCEL